METIQDFTTNLEFQEAFRAYFEEIGIPLKPDTGVWDEIAASAEKEGTVCRACRRDGVLAGFILFQTDALRNSVGFLVRKVGFIREVWVRPEYRRQGLGRELLACAEEEFRAAGAVEMILTCHPDSFGFYAKLGFTLDPAYTAMNRLSVVVRPIEREAPGNGEV